MSGFRRINWLSGLPLCHSDLKEQDNLNNLYAFKVLNNMNGYGYGISKLSIDHSSLLQGILYIKDIFCVFSDGSIIDGVVGSISLNINDVYKNSAVPIYLKPIHVIDSRYLVGSGLLNVHGGLLIGNVEIHGGSIQLSANGCYSDVQSNVSFIIRLNGVLNRVSEAMEIHHQHTLTFSGDEYAKALFELLSIKQLISDLTLISYHSVHPFYAYSLLRRYINGCSIKYNHDDGIGVLDCILSAIDTIYSIPGRKYIIEQINGYYQIPINDSIVRILITPYSDDVFKWIQNVHISSMSHLDEIERKRHKGLARRVYIRNGNIIAEINRDNNYMEGNMVVMEVNDQIQTIFIIQ